MTALDFDVLAAAREAQSYVAGRTLDDFLDDSQLRRAVERCIEIIGEAARGLSKDFITAHPETNWRAIVAQRHILAHDYASVEPVRIWRVATLRLGELVKAIDTILAEG